MKPDLSTEVADALRAGHPVVALESTIIAHGMPWPQNVETALAVEAEVRASGATPATVAILDGRLKAGLTRGEIERLARGGREIAKVSRRDISIVMARSGTGATTVAATMIIADMAGMRLFSTGGIGGVHRGAETTFDVSADLQELARTPVAVVCAGPPFLLNRVNALSGGDSVAANIQLARSNAKLAAKIAVAYAALTTRA